MAKKFMDYAKTYGVLGGVTAIATPFVFKTISNLVSMIPGVTVDLQAISIQTTGVTSVIGTDLSRYAQKLFGFLPLTMADWVMTFIGGALFVMLGAWIYDNVKQIQFAKTKAGKLATIFTAAGIASGWLISWAVGIPAIETMLVMAVNALIFSWIWVLVDKTFKLKLIP